MNKTFKVAQVRGLLNQVNNEQITFSRFVEILNEAQSSPKIKQLEWLVSEDTETMLAKIPFNNYYIIDGVDGMIFLTINSQYHIGRYATIDEAKAAAQADFEKRVKECLE